MDDLEKVKQALEQRTEKSASFQDLEKKLEDSIQKSPEIGNDLKSDSVEIIYKEIDDKSKKIRGRRSIEDSVIPVSVDAGKYYSYGLEVGFIKRFDDVVLPEYKRDGDACMDVRAYRIIELRNDQGIVMPLPENFESVTLYNGYTVMIGLGFGLDIPNGHAINILPRSGFSYDEGIIILNSPGKADTTFNGEYAVMMGKINKKPTVISKNNRIAQMEIVPQIKMSLVERDKYKNDPDNTRLESGFGSSGIV